MGKKNRLSSMPSAAITGYKLLTLGSFLVVMAGLAYLATNTRAKRQLKLENEFFARKEVSLVDLLAEGVPTAGTVLVIPGGGAGEEGDGGASAAFVPVYVICAHEQAVL